MKSRFYKLIWYYGGYAIIRRPRKLKLECKRKIVWGYFVYGTRRKYEDCGKQFVFEKFVKIEELDPQYVIDNHFEGLL